MIIGTAGHIGHGKTAPIEALIGIDADPLKEETARDITIDLGFTYRPLPDGDVLAFVNAPGHEKLIRNLMVGATGIDHVLPVAADEGPMPQTPAHLGILDRLPPRAARRARDVRHRRAKSDIQGRGSSPGGASGLQNRVGPLRGPGWVRLPPSSAIALR